MLVHLGVRKAAVLELASKTKPAFVVAAQRVAGTRLSWANHFKPRSSADFDGEQIVVNTELTSPGLLGRFRRRYERDEEVGAALIGNLLEYPCDQDPAHEYVVDFSCWFQIYENGECVQGRTPFDQNASTNLAATRCGRGGDRKQLERALGVMQKRWVLPATMRLVDLEFPLAATKSYMRIAGFGVHLRKG